MSGKIKIGGLVLTAALVVLGAWFAFGQVNQDPCGGTYKGEGLKATFLPVYSDIMLIIPPPASVPWPPTMDDFVSNIFNGNADYYQYVKPGGDCVFLYRNGHVIVGVSWPLTDPYINHDRYINMRFDRKGDGSCPIIKDPEDPCYALPAFMVGGQVVHTTAIQFWTNVGFTASRGFAGIPGDPRYPADTNILFLKGTNALLNFAALTPGNTIISK